MSQESLKQFIKDYSQKTQLQEIKKKLKIWGTILKPAPSMLLGKQKVMDMRFYSG